MQVRMKLMVQHFLVSSVWIAGVLGAGLHGACESDQECGTIDTFCHKNVCVCKENFAVLYDSCIALARPRQSCTHKNDCHKALGSRSICTKKKQCACKAFHHLHMGQCVKNRDLSHQCDHDHQCYCGAGCEDKIACIHHSCTCKREYTPFGARRCLSPPNEENVTALQEIFNSTTPSISDPPTESVLATESRSTSIPVEVLSTFESNSSVSESNSSIFENRTIKSEEAQAEVPSVILESTVMRGLTSGGVSSKFRVHYGVVVGFVYFAKNFF